MLGYPVGGPNWGSTFSLLCVVAGVVALVRRRQWLLLGLLLAPLGLNFVAAALHRFPYGGHARMTLFLAPAFCLLIAFGLTAALAWIEGAATSRSPAAWAWPAAETLNGCTIALGLLALLGAGSWLRDVTQPYKSATTLRAREFAQWFWFEMAHDSELVSCETDLKTDLSPDKLNCGWSSLYFCNQRIYSPRHARGEKPQLERVSVDRPLRCVLYRSPKEEQESPPPIHRPGSGGWRRCRPITTWSRTTRIPLRPTTSRTAGKSATITSRFSSLCPRGGNGTAAKTGADDALRRIVIRRNITSRDRRLRQPCGTRP